MRRASALCPTGLFAGTILLSHLHWDHLHGLPFFLAAIQEDSWSDVLIPDQRGGESALEVVARGMSPPHFPVRPEELGGRWSFSSLSPSEFEVEGFHVTAREIPHASGVTFGYRVSDGHSTLTYMPDHYPSVLGLGVDGWGEYHPAALELAEETDLLVHDSQLVAEEIESEAWFGHAAAEYAAGLARAARARHTALFHYKPDRTDDPVAGARPLTRGSHVDAAVVGSGPNGLAAALVLARAGLHVEVFEAASRAGGGCRTDELTLPGFRHDVCSTIQSMIARSPFFGDVDLVARGVRLRVPEVAFAHPLDGDRAAALEGSVSETLGSAGREVGPLNPGAHPRRRGAPSRDGPIWPGRCAFRVASRQAFSR